MRHLSHFFRGWQFYIRIVLVPSIMCAFGIQASLEGKVLRYYLADKIKVPLCITPILLILLLTTADDSFSSKSHKELVRNLSVLMVADLFDAIEMLNNAFEGSSEAFDVSTIFLVIGAIITVIVSSLQMAEYEFIEGVEGESKEQIRYKPNVSRKIAELVINVVVLTIRLKALIEHGKTRSTHRRTGNFFARGAVNHLPNKILASCPNFYETVETKRGPYDAITKAVLAYEGGSILQQFFRVNTFQF